MDIKKYIEISVTVSLIIIIILIGIVVIQRTGNDFLIAKGFCIDKEGQWNISTYDDFLDYDILNCSDKEHYGMAIEMIS